MIEYNILENSDCWEIRQIINDFKNRHKCVDNDLILYISSYLYKKMLCKMAIVHYRGLNTLCGIRTKIDNDLEYEIIRIENRRYNMGIDCRNEIRISGLTFATNYLVNKNNLPDKVQFNKKKKATTLIFDDDVIVVKQNKNDREDYEKAFLWAYFIKKSGLSKTQASKYIDKIMEENNGKQ